MGLGNALGALYRRLARHRVLLVAGWCLAAALLAAVSLNMRLQEDLRAMLPGESGGAAGDFDYLSRTPILRKIAVLLTAAEGTPTAELTAAAKRLAGALESPWFENATAGPAEPSPRFLEKLIAALPAMADPADLDAMAKAASPEAIQRSVKSNYAMLTGPEGLAMKGIIRLDPLGWRSLELAKLARANAAPGARLADGVFVSRDGRRALVLANSGVAVTDGPGSRELVDAFGRAAKASLGPGVTAELVAGHRVAAYNEATVKRDIRLVVAVSGAAILLIFLLFVRSWQALVVYASPLFAMAAGSAAVALAFPSVSGLTLGFGAVLMGICVDYSLHVYFALRAPGQSPPSEERLVRVAGLVLAGFATTAGAFVLLAFSELPVLRQLAVFALGGLAGAVAYALVLLPPLITPGKAAPFPLPLPGDPSPARRKATLAVWAVLMAACLALGLRVSINGDLRRLSLFPEDFKRAEAELAQSFGNVRDRAVVFAEADSRAGALAANERVERALLDAKSPALPPDRISTLAPLLPSPESRRANKTRFLERFGGQRAAEIESALGDAAREYGFSKDAFAPFARLLATGGEPLDAEGLRAIGLGQLVELYLSREQGEYYAMTMIPDNAQALEAAGKALSAQEDVRLVSGLKLRTELSRAIRADFLRFTSLALVLVTAVLAALFRKPGRVLAALAPALSGLLLALGVMGAASLDFLLPGVAASVLIIGLGVDYGIFMASLPGKNQKMDPATARAVFVSGLTTLAGFGALALARQPVLQSMGLTVLFGIAGAVPAALLVTPCLARRRS